MNNDLHYAQDVQDIIKGIQNIKNAYLNKHSYLNLYDETAGEISVFLDVAPDYNAIYHISIDNFSNNSEKIKEKLQEILKKIMTGKTK